MGENGLSASDVAVLSGNYGRSNNDGGFGGGDWGAWIILFLLFGLFGNRGGFGGGSGGNCGCGSPCATQADVRAAVDQQTLISKLDQQTYGLADSTYALNNTITGGFAGVQQTLCQGFNGMNIGMLQGFNGLQSELADCCCKTQRAIDGVNYNMATQACDTRNIIQNSTRDLLENQNTNTRAILDFITNSRMEDLRAENTALKSQIGISNQNAVLQAYMDANKAEILRRTGAECPTAAYIVQPPQPVTFPVNSCGQFSGYGCNGGCGCN